MTMNTTNPKVDWYFTKANTWQDEINKLRAIVLSCPLTEELKWGVACYTFQASNVVLIHYFKEYCALLFVKGALLKDPDNILVQQTANVQAARQIRFTSVEQIATMEHAIKAYLQAAIEAEKAGLKMEFKKVTEFDITEELTSKFNEIPALKTAFETLTPGRQRAYLLYFSAPKLSQTREARIEKCTDQILDGLGLDD